MNNPRSKPRRRPGRRRRRRDGFTLIELLLVLVILTVLALIVVPKFAGRSKQARVAAAKAGIANIKLALSAFEVDCARYPTTAEGLKALVEAPADLQDEWNPEGYIDGGLPRDPWGNPYDYKYPGDHNTRSYDLWSYGPDGQNGGADDIGNWEED